MKVISLLQPWASLVVHGHKLIETRSWNTKYRGELLIHASISKKKEAIELYNDSKMSFLYESLFRGIAYNDLPFGAIIGKVNLVDTCTTDLILHTNRKALEFNETTYHLDEQEMTFGDYSPGRYGWLLSDPILFDKPIACKGQLSIWNLPIELESLVREQVGKKISFDKSVEIYRSNVWPRDENGNHIKMSEKERLRRINEFRCQGYF
jgi:hypothetical protein